MFFDTNMKEETVTLIKRNNGKPKKKTEVDWELVRKIRRSLEDLKHGRFEIEK